MNDWFPIMGEPSYGKGKWWIPWSVIAPHEAQARANHSQTLERLAERGGLDPVEALAVLRDQPFRAIDHSGDYAVSSKELAKLVFSRLDATAYKRGYDDGLAERDPT